MQVFITKKAGKEMDDIPDPLAKNIVQRLTGLADNLYPANSKKLAGENNYRMRIGVYRAIYAVNSKSKSVTVLRIAHRKEVYR